MNSNQLQHITTPHTTTPPKEKSLKDHFDGFMNMFKSKPETSNTPSVATNKVGGRKTRKHKKTHRYKSRKHNILHRRKRSASRSASRRASRSASRSASRKASRSLAKR